MLDRGRDAVELTRLSRDLPPKLGRLSMDRQFFSPQSCIFDANRCKSRCFLFSIGLGKGGKDDCDFHSSLVTVE